MASHGERALPGQKDGGGEAATCSGERRAHRGETSMAEGPELGPPSGPELPPDSWDSAWGLASQVLSSQAERASESENIRKRSNNQRP